VRRAARTDATAKELRAYAESLGFVVVVISGVVDCLLVWNSDRIFIVDWKSKGGTLTSEQARLTAKGVRIRFISTPLQLDQLKAEVTG
jgi:ATP-dependent exoDNAse (exonuclease V) beta subunit